MGGVAPSVTRFAAEPESARAARTVVTQRIEDWGLHHLLADALLCVTELVANAIVHSRAPFVVLVRRVGEGLRIDVVDDRPGQLPVVVPRDGTASDITLQASTGRGLQIVASLAARWGYTSTDTAKAVWVELMPFSDSEATEPVVSVTSPPPPSGQTVELDLRQLPVRAAVASGMSVEATVRMLLVDRRKDLTDDDKAQLHHLLDESAQPRLEGRHAALRAASLRQHLFDLPLVTTREALAAIPRLTEHLARLVDALDLSEVEVPHEVVRFRTWLQQETQRQLAGEAPRPHP